MRGPRPGTLAGQLLYDLPDSEPDPNPDRLVQVRGAGGHDPGAAGHGDGPEPGGADRSASGPLAALLE